MPLLWAHPTRSTDAYVQTLSSDSKSDSGGGTEALLLFPQKRFWICPDSDVQGWLRQSALCHDSGMGIDIEKTQMMKQVAEY